LPVDTALRSGRQVFLRVRNGHRAVLLRVLEFDVTAGLIDFLPTFTRKSFDNVGAVSV
jgi:hypothetical protein